MPISRRPTARWSAELLLLSSHAELVACLLDQDKCNVRRIFCLLFAYNEMGKQQLAGSLVVIQPGIRPRCKIPL